MFVLIAACLWGTAPIFVRKGLPHASASVGVLCGLLASLPVIVLVFVVHPRSVTQVISPQAAGWFIAAGISGPCLGRMFNYLGVAHLGAAKSTPLVNTSPLFTTVLALIFLQEHLTLKILGGILSVVAGVAVLTGQNRGRG
jgi:drug/metabolite transporter (DMT)-like permease